MVDMGTDVTRNPGRAGSSGGNEWTFGGPGRVPYQAGVLHLLLAVLVPLGIAALLVHEGVSSPRPFAFDPGLAVKGGTILLLAAALIVNRLGRYHWAVAVFLATASLSTFLFLAVSADAAHRVSVPALFIMLSIFSSVFLPVLSAAVYSMLNIVVLVVMHILVRDMPWGAGCFERIGLILAVSTLVLVIAGYRNHLEYIRRREWTERESRYRDFIDNFQGIAYQIGVGPDGKPAVDFFRGRVREITGYDEKDFISERVTWENLVHQDDTRRFHDESRRLRETAGYVADLEYRICSRDGRIRWVRDTCRIGYVERKNLHILQGAVYDITDRKELQQQLHHAEKMEAIGQLAGGVAHDYNNQLAGILGCAQLLKRSLDPGSEAHENASIIEKAAQRSARLTTQLLAFARRGPVEYVGVDMNRVVDAAVELIEHAVDKKIVIRRELCDGPFIVKGDPAQLENVVINLALNARDAMEEGGTITLATDTAPVDMSAVEFLAGSPGAGAYGRLRVRDTGKGISRGVRKRMFEPFFTTKEPGKGTGMGLAAVYGTIHGHHGAIDVRSRRGEGTTFTLFLPLAREEEPVRPSPPEVAAGSGKKGCILIVDDEESLRNVLSRMLKTVGYSTVICADGEEAVRQYRRSSAQIDCVLLDYTMPKMSGFEVFTAIREIRPDARIVLLSGYSMDDKVRRLLRTGGCSFVQKPFQIQDLCDTIETTIHSGSS